VGNLVWQRGPYGTCLKVGPQNTQANAWHQREGWPSRFVGGSGRSAVTIVMGSMRKDLCPSPNQPCLDGFEFVDRVGLNLSGDAVFALYFLVHLPCPPSLTLNRIGCGDGVEGRREGQSRRPRLRPHGVWGAASWNSGRWRKADGEAQFSSALPSLRGSRESPQAPAMEYVIVAE
jgi:hypothetical protein